MSNKTSAQVGKSNPSDNVMRDIAPYLSLGMQMSSAIIFCGFVGWLLDSSFRTEPYLLIVMLLFGIISGMTMFIRTALRAGKKS